MQKLINQKIKELTENGKLDEIVTKRAIDFINGIITDALHGYSDASKQFKQKLNSSLIEGFEKIDFVQYSKILIDLIESELNKSVVEYGITPAKEMIQKFVGAFDKKEWKLSEIIEKFKEEVIPDEYGQSGEIAFFNEESSYGTYWIGFDEESDNKIHKYQCKYKIGVDKKTKMLYSPTIEGLNIHPLSQMGLAGFDLFLFKLYAMGCTVDCDFENIETLWSTFED
jgi:hypothetical protein